jgi:hypothetical protein
VIIAHIEKRDYLCTTHQYWVVSLFLSYKMKNPQPIQNAEFFVILATKTVNPHPNRLKHRFTKGFYTE